jgi:hypothetical protein
MQAMDSPNFHGCNSHSVNSRTDNCGGPHSVDRSLVAAWELLGAGQCSPRTPDGQQLLSTGADPNSRLFPPPALTAWSNLLYASLTRNTSRQQWREWVAPDIGDTELCHGLPIAPDSGTS